jgi:Protein of unknown function with PCYCGC motif
MSRSKSNRASDRRPWIIAGAAALVILFIGAGAWSLRSASDVPSTKTRSLTLDPNLFSGPAREAYEIAARDPALLAQLHCYCGCDKELGHRNLLDCYRTEHGGQCPVCTGEVLEARKLADEGLPIDQIRRVLRDHWAHED